MKNGNLDGMTTQELVRNLTTIFLIATTLLLLIVLGNYHDDPIDRAVLFSPEELSESIHGSLLYFFRPDCERG